MSDAQADRLVELPNVTDEVGVPCTVMMTEEYDSDQVQNINFILVPESLLQALKNSGYDIPDIQSNNPDSLKSKPVAETLETSSLLGKVITGQEQVSQVRTEPSLESVVSEARTNGNIEGSYVLSPTTQFLALDTSDNYLVDGGNGHTVLPTSVSRLITTTERSNMLFTPSNSVNPTVAINQIAPEIPNTKPAQTKILPSTTGSPMNCINGVMLKTASTTLTKEYPRTVSTSSIQEYLKSHSNHADALMKDNEAQTMSSAMTYKCVVFNCKKSFSSFKELEKHSFSHMKHHVYKCTHPNCPWSFKTPYKLKRHMQSHVQEKQYKCEHPGCSKVCSTSYNLRAHEKTHSTENHHSCTECKETFKDKHKLHKHIRDVHRIGASFPCSYKNCDRIFRTSAALTAHLNAHMKLKIFEYVCNEPGCNKVFKKKCFYLEHMMSQHTGVRPFKCNFPGCKWAFTTKSKLTRHQTTHSATKRFFCPFESCQSGFHRLEHLKCHIKVHSGNEKSTKNGAAAGSAPELPIESSEDNLIYYLCPYEECGSLFTTLIGAKQHIQKIHGSTVKPGDHGTSDTTSTDPVSISLEAVIKSESESDSSAVSKNNVSVIITGGDIADDAKEKKKTPPTPIRNSQNVSSLLSTMLQSQSTECRTEDILINSKPQLDTVTQDLQFVGMDTADQGYTDTRSLELDSVPDFALSVHEPMSSRVDPSQYLLGTSGDFVSSSSDVSDADTMDFISISQQSVYAASSSADRFLNFSECVPTVDPNMVMSVPTSTLLDQPCTSTSCINSTNFENTDEEDSSTGGNISDESNNNVAIGSARTDCNAYLRACIDKKNKITVNNALFLSTKPSFLDECQGSILEAMNTGENDKTRGKHLQFASSISSFILNGISRKDDIPDLRDDMRGKNSFFECSGLMETNRHSDVPNHKSGDLESLRDCDRDFASSTINLSDLA